MNWVHEPFSQMTLPIIVAMLLASWTQNRSFDGINKRIDDLAAGLNRLDDIIKRLD